MNILVGKCFGIGNAVMCVPMIKALKSLGHTVDVLIGSLPDDQGAIDVFRMFRDERQGFDSLYLNEAPLSKKYDKAIMSIPFDGRWHERYHFVAEEIVDGRPRPDPSTTGLGSWKKHEVEYQMDNAFALGYSGEVPDCSFSFKGAREPNVYYLGVGYKKDAAGFWKQKHWGNENYAELIRLILDSDSEAIVRTSGDMMDLQLSIKPIAQMVGSPRFIYEPGNIRQSMEQVQYCSIYIGNDTGMGHVAAAAGLKVVTVHNLQNSIVKSHPWCDSANRRELDGSERPVTVDQFFASIKELR